MLHFYCIPLKHEDNVAERSRQMQLRYKEATSR
jgi:hypothetical protein